MKKFKKNFSKTVFASFFVLQFVVGTSFMPIIARAEESIDSVDSTESQIESPASETKVEETAEVSLDENTSLPSFDNKEVGEFVGDESSREALAGVQGQFVDADLTVCKVLLDEEGNIVSDWSQFQGAEFETTLKLQGTDHSFSFGTSGNTFSQDYNFATVCEKQTGSVNLAEQGLITIGYEEETTSGDYTWTKNYFEGDAQGEGGLYLNGVPMFAPFTVNDTAYDGTLSLNGNSDTGFSATLFLVNQLEGSVCDVPPVYARVNLTGLAGTSAFGKNNQGWGNTGIGNMAPNIFVGGTNPASNEMGGDVYQPGEWFLVYDPATGYINDPVLTAVDPGINGLAVQRLDGQVRVVLYGSHQQPQGAPLTNREMANGFVEFSDDGSTVSTDIVITNQIADAVNPPEPGNGGTPAGYTGNPIDWPNRDAIWFTPTKSYFKFVVNTHNDGMYTVFSHELPTGENCGGDDTNHPPVITVTSPVCISMTETEETYNFFGGVSAVDFEDGVITEDVVVINHDIHFGFEGQYSIEYAVVDSDGLAAEATRTVFIKKDCGSGGGGGGGSCASTSNLIDNGGFETPVITSQSGWGIYPDGTSGLKWSVAWQVGAGDGTTPKAELQKIYTAHTGEQYIELDSDFQGPGGGASNDPASTAISQTITTVPGQEYEISYYYAARPGYGYADNKVGLYIDGFPWDLSVTTDGTNDTDAVWFLKKNHFTANSTSHTITFADLGTPNSYGMFLDDIKVICVDDDGGGDEKNTPPVIVVDPEIVQVELGAECLANQYVMDLDAGVTVNDLEDGNGVIVPSVSGIVNCDLVGSYVITYNATDSGNPTNDPLSADPKTRTIKVVTGGTGGGDDDDPVLTVPENACYETNSVSNFDFLDGVSAEDFTGTTLTLNLTDNVLGEENVNFTQEGTYTVTYTVTDPFGTDTHDRVFTVSDDCDNGGGGGGGGGNGGGGNGGGSSSGSGTSRQGEVLGASSCIAFTTYNRLGSTDGEVKALQTFLNEYMDAGLTVDGVYGPTTVQAVHDFQAYHWSDIIDPWTPPLSPNTTGWEYKTTRATINAIIDCPEAPVFLEDPGTMFSITEATDEKMISDEALLEIMTLLAEAQGITFDGGSTSSN